jgi:hypothetical protein
MRKKLLKIVNHYGIRKQTKYLMSEIYELVEAIIEKEESGKILDEITRYAKEHGGNENGNN